MLTSAMIKAVIETNMIIALEIPIAIPMEVTPNSGKQYFIIKIEPIREAILTILMIVAINVLPKPNKKPKQVSQMINVGIVIQSNLNISLILLTNSSDVFFVLNKEMI